MSAISSMLGNAPGMGSPVEEFQSAFTWGPTWLFRYVSGIISSAAVDSTNTPTTTLRMGLVLGKIAASGLWTNYSASATDGSNVAQGVLCTGLRMLDVLSGSVTQKYWYIMVSGALKAANLIGLDSMAREQLAANFMFDDDLFGRSRYPFKQFQVKATNYTVTANDNQSLFENTGAIGTVVLTLPTLANGLVYGLKCTENQVFRFTSVAGGDMIGTTTTQTSCSVTAIGGGLRVYSNPAATKWHVDNMSSYSQVVSFA